MKNWWNWLLLFGLACLLFLAIPLTYPKNTNKEQLRSMFDQYIDTFNKKYKNDTAEYEARLEHFAASVKEIDELNAASRGPEGLKARYGLTALSDMSKAEYREKHLSDEQPHRRRKHHFGKSLGKGKGIDIYNLPDDDVDLIYGINPAIHEEGSHHNIYVIIRNKRETLPMTVDWREKGIIGPIQNQGVCGACWAFSTVGVIGAMAAISSGKFKILSVQEVIDCAGLGNSGCAGGDICLLLDWLMLTNTPLQMENQYPLQLTDGACVLKKNATGVRVKNFTCDSYVGSEDKLLEMIATHGPVAVAVNALSWQNYLGGVVQYHCSGSPLDLNHAVELVGYDLTADVPYYIAKNTWGLSFGNLGYIKLAIGSNMCGLANEVASVDVSV